MPLEIIFENDILIAINKPHGLLVHRTRIAADAEEFALQLLRDQTGQRVYPAHRLDRKTSGVLLFAKTPEANSTIQRLFRERLVIKVYRAVVRGWIPQEGVIDYAIGENGKTQAAQTTYQLIQKFELNIPSGKHLTSRYSLVTLTPHTGRYHQLRKHLAHIFHPIIGDRPHGCNKQNKIWKERFGMTKMLLHAEQIRFELPEYGMIDIWADKSDEFQRVILLLNETSK